MGNNPNCLWDSQRERERENFPVKSWKAQLGLLIEQRIERIPEKNLMAADWPLPPVRGREAGRLQPEPEGEGQSRHQGQHPPPNCEQAPNC